MKAAPPSHYRATAPVHSPRFAVRLARVIALAVVMGVGINHIWWSAVDWHLDDMDAYWEAAVRLRAGAPLFPPVSDVLASDVYRYSPWFAWLWVPLTAFPRGAVNIAWSVALLLASAAALWPMVRRRAWLAVAFFFPILVGISAGGNVHVLLVTAVVWGLERRSGPLWLGVVASLKLFPVLFVLTYVGRRQWRRAAVTLAVTGVLLVPFLAYDLSDYVTTPGGAALLWDWPAVYWPVVSAASALAVWAASKRWAWLASSAAVVLALPRSFVYDVTWVLAGFPAGSQEEARTRTSRSASAME